MHQSNNNYVVDVALIGPGLVGKEVLKQLTNYLLPPPTFILPTTKANNKDSNSAVYPVLNLVGIISTKRMLVSPSIPLSEWKKEFDENGVVADMTLFIETVRSVSRSTIIIECSSDDEIANQYPSWLKNGMHVVTPNKKAFSGELGLWREILRLTRKRTSVPYPICMFEATVGAGLPVISTLKDLVANGDKIVKIEGILSGTLSFIFNEFSTPFRNSAGSPSKFSEIVKRAKELGYTEPDPRDDLNGIDVARKVVILSRVCNIDLRLENLPVENVVPPELRGVNSIEEFMDKLPEFDDHFDNLAKNAGDKGEVLRYVGIISDCPDKNGRASEVRLKRFSYSHPFASLRGSDNIITFYTDRFPSGLSVMGSGAGAAVTAHGVLSDVLKIADIVSYNK
jgi:homoserine dehydrogenase